MLHLTAPDQSDFERSMPSESVDLKALLKQLNRLARGVLKLCGQGDAKPPLLLDTNPANLVGHLADFASSVERYLGDEDPEAMRESLEEAFPILRDARNAYEMGVRQRREYEQRNLAAFRPAKEQVEAETAAMEKSDLLRRAESLIAERQQAGRDRVSAAAALGVKPTTTNVAATDRDRAREALGIKQ